MNIKKIDKLKEKVFQGADSKLYIPIAEEYKKINMIDEAVKVLKYCIKKHPNYMSARVALGKIYMEQGYQANAIEEFETVVSAIPDNLLSHKKLAELYKSTGNISSALRSLERILALNPKDEDAQNLIHDLSTQPIEEVKTEKIIPDSQEYDEDVRTVEIVPDSREDEMQIPKMAEQAVLSVISDEVTNELINAANANNQRIDVEEDMGTDEIDKIVADGEVQTDDIETHVEAIAKQDQDSDKIIEHSEPVQPPSELLIVETSSESLLQQELKAIDRHIESEHFITAVLAYNRLLKQYPEDKKIRQRRQEVIRYAKLIKKDENIWIEKLNTFYTRISEHKWYV
ncbi:MAG: tetratricopeptide repeat protein [Nitrospirae bacterium]|nr:tetratricopeptide repeat protein [Nitrospirota bacterium]